MATTVGNLVVKLTASTGRFTKRMNKAGSTVGRFVKSVGRVASRVAKMGAAMAAVATGALALFVREQMKAIDATALVAQRIGTTTEALAGLQHAARMTGADTERLQEGLTELVQRLGEAKTDTGSAADGLKMIGLEAAELSRLRPEQAFMRIADAVNRLPNTADRVFAIDEIFGGDGRRLINLLQLGSDGIRQLMDDARAMGATFDNIEASQVRQASQAMERLGALASGVGRRLTVELAPFIEAAASKLVAMGTSGEGMGLRVTRAVESVATGIAHVTRGIDLAKGAFFTFEAVVKVVASGVVRYISEIVLGFEAMREFITGATSDTGKFLRAMSDDFFLQSGQSMQEAGEAFKAFSDETRVNKVRDAFAKIRADAEKMAGAATDTQMSFDAMPSATDDEPEAPSRSPSRELPRLLRAGTASAIEFVNRQRAGERSAMDRLHSVNEKQVSEIKTTNRLLRDAQRDVDPQVVVAF